jgi:uncharacterized membrane protein YhhN
VTIGEAGLGASAILAVIDWIAVTRGDERLERRVKPAVLVPLIAAVLLSHPDASTRSLLLAIALAASLAGDALLLPPERFTYGLVAFFVAHVAFLAVFLLGPVQAPLAVMGALAAGAVLLGIGRGILAGATRAGLRRPVGAYLAAIFFMAIAATASGSPVAAAGAWLFVASDAILGWDRFAAQPAATPRAVVVRRLAVIIPYHAAQLLLTAALLGVG